MSLGRKSKGSEGFIPISRKLFNNFLWEEKREFSRAEAWIDLLQLARFEANSTKEIINGRVIEYKRGERPLSLRLLADRWKWSKNRVEQRDACYRIPEKGDVDFDGDGGSEHYPRSYLYLPL